MKDFKIIEIMELFDEDEVTTADQIDRPQRALDREMFDDFNKRNPMAGGGMLVQPGFGGMRQGYRSDKFIRAQGSGQQKSKEMIKFLNYATNNKNKIKNKTLTEIIEASGANVDISNARKRLKENKIKIGTADKSKVIKEVKSKTEKPVFDGVNNFAKNWINKNQKKYGVTEYDKFISDFANDWQKELNKPLYKNYTGDRILSNPDGTPKTNTLFGKQDTGFTINDLKPPGERTSGLFYKRVFYKNKLKNKDFKKKVNNYLDWVLQDKRGKGNLGLQGGSKSNYLKAAQKIGLDIDKDVLYFFGEVMQGDLLTAGEGFYSIVDKELGGNKASKYKNKLNISYQNWINNIEEVSKLAGVDSKVIINNQLKESKKMTELFGLKKLPFEFRYAQDHLFGLAEAKALGDPRIAKQTLTNLVASTKEQNTILGTKGFSAKRTALIKRFKNASLENKANIVNQLNTLAEKYVPGRLQYNVKKDGSLKITNLQPETTFKSRAEAYKNLAKDFPTNIKKKVSSLDEGEFKKLLASFSANPKCRANFSRGGRIGYATGPANLSECAISGRNRLEKVIKGGVKLGEQEGALARQILKAGRSLGSAFTLSGLLGPQALLFTGLAEAGFVGYDYLTTGKTLKEVIGDSLLNYALGEKTKIDPQKELFKRFSGLGYSDEQIGNFANVLNQTNTLNTILKQDLKVGNLAEEVKAFREQPKDQFMSPDDEMLQTDAAIRAEQKLKDEQKNLENLLINYRSQPPVGLNMEDTILGDMASGKFQETQQDLQAANIFADIEKEKTAADRLAGFEGAISEQARADRIAGLEQDYLNLLQERGPELTPFAGGGIAKLAGIDEGPQTVSMNPDSQGLQSLKNRVKNI